MATVHSVAKATVHASINMEYIEECEVQNVTGVYMLEYGYRGVVSSKACCDYLQGLPSFCSVPFMNYDILKLLEANGITRETEDGRYSLIEQYWVACGYHFYQILERERVTGQNFSK